MQNCELVFSFSIIYDSFLTKLHCKFLKTKTLINNSQFYIDTYKDFIFQTKVFVLSDFHRIRRFGKPNVPTQGYV